MEKEYIIINKTTIQKRIDELETKRNSEHKKGRDKSALRYENTILELKQILSQSTPLIPDIEKAYDAGYLEGYNLGQNDAEKHPLALSIANHIHKDKKDYISNLKLDI